MYDMKPLIRIPCRYTVDAAKLLTDEWGVNETACAYDREVYGLNGYFHKMAGNIRSVEPEIKLEYNRVKGGISIALQNHSAAPIRAEIISNAYDCGKLDPISLAPGEKLEKHINLAKSNNWYDFTVKTAAGFLHRFAGRVETGKHGISDPAMATEL